MKLSSNDIVDSVSEESGAVLFSLELDPLRTIDAVNSEVELVAESSRSSEDKSPHSSFSPSMSIPMSLVRSYMVGK